MWLRAVHHDVRMFVDNNVYHRCRSLGTGKGSDPQKLRGTLTSTPTQSLSVYYNCLFQSGLKRHYNTSAGSDCQYSSALELRLPPLKPDEGSTLLNSF